MKPPNKSRPWQRASPPPSYLLHPPVPAGLWWIQLLRAYGRCTGDLSLQSRGDVQTGIRLIIEICLADHFDMFPTLITTDGSCMIDRRLGIHGHPLEIQVECCARGASVHLLNLMFVAPTCCSFCCHLHRRCHCCRFSCLGCWCHQWLMVASGVQQHSHIIAGYDLSLQRR